MLTRYVDPRSERAAQRQLAVTRISAEHKWTFVVDVPDLFAEAFVIEKDSQRSSKSGGRALFNDEAASDKFTAEASPSDCEHTCHM
jgi:hypothetical protein